MYLKPLLIVIVGPTAVGKTELSIRLAEFLDTEIVSADSRQIYKEMTIGTAVPNRDELSRVKHHFIQTISVHDYYSAGIYEIEALKKIDELFEQKQQVILVGGSGMYVDAVCKGIDDFPEIDMDVRNELIHRFETEGVDSLRFELMRLDPKSYKHIDLQNPKRILKALEITIQTGKPYFDYLTKPKKERPFDILKIGIERPREDLYARINNRVDLMLSSGLENEAKYFYEIKHLNSLNTVGYKELFSFFDGEIDFDEAVRQLKRNTRHYAKRQLTWFKRDSEIHWFSPDDYSEVLSLIKKNIAIKIIN